MFIVFITFVFYISCKKKEINPEELLYGKKWVWTEWAVNPGYEEKGKIITDLFADFADDTCYTKTSYYFFDTGKFYPEKPCETYSKYIGDWHLFDNGKKISIDGLEQEIIELNENKLSFSYKLMMDDSGILYTMKYSYIAK